MMGSAPWNHIVSHSREIGEGNLAFFRKLEEAAFARG